MTVRFVSFRQLAVKILLRNRGTSAPRKSKETKLTSHLDASLIITSRQIPRHAVAAVWCHFLHSLLLRLQQRPRLIRRMTSEGLLPENSNSTNTTDDVQPYSWQDSHPPPQETLQMWIDVGNGIDKNQTGELKFSSSFFFILFYFCGFSAAPLVFRRLVSNEAAGFNALI